MISPEASAIARDRVKQTGALRKSVRHAVQAGRWLDAEPDASRRNRFVERRLDNSVPPGAEAVQGDTIDFQRACFLPAGAKVRRAVGYVEVNDPRRVELGSGFLISPRLFLTNQHVVTDAAAALATQVTFDREWDALGRPVATTTYRLDPAAFNLFSKDSELDYALVALGDRNTGSADPEQLGCCPISDSPDRHVLGMNVNIIQHPHGWPKMITIRNNLLTARTDRTLLYETDTEQGSSGSPIFNDDWEIIGLHHWGAPFLERQDDQGHQISKNVNEGVRISAIYRDLKTRLPTLTEPQRQLLDEALSLADRASQPDLTGPTLSGPRIKPKPIASPVLAGNESVSITPSRNPNMIPDSNGNELRVTIPLQICIKIGDSGPIRVEASDSPDAVTVEKALTEKTLRKASEAIQLDTDYSNRSGYVAGFIPGEHLPLPELNQSLRLQVAPLRADQPNAESGELKYTHFSIKMHRANRLAIFTATNIDGETYLSVNRTTGEVGNGSEGETWFPENRISSSFYIDQSFYSQWSIYFDRGHLTRRTDPTWGTSEEAERANADTFHFTNCSPQHFRFNQTTKFWQGAERYVLENGLLAQETKRRICVYQGPIFDDAIDHMADDIQIPSSFYKVIVWKSHNKLKAVGLIVDQLPLLDEKRKPLGPPRSVSAVDVTQWRVSIKQIEKRTGLIFDQIIHEADTINLADQPNIGEAARPIRAFEDILK